MIAAVGVAQGVLVGVAVVALPGGLAINYWKWDAMYGLWLESHFMWQLMTFWWYFVVGVFGPGLRLLSPAGVLVLLGLVLRRVGRAGSGSARTGPSTEAGRSGGATARHSTSSNSSTA